MAVVRVTYLHTVGVDADNADPNVANAVTLFQRANTALTTNATFLAIGSPTQAQTVTQVQALTRQIDGIIRLMLNQLATITDS